MPGELTKRVRCETMKRARKASYYKSTRNGLKSYKATHIRTAKAVRQGNFTLVKTSNREPIKNEIVKTVISKHHKNEQGNKRVHGENGKG